MATYSSREIISRRIEYTVPAPWPQGAVHADLLAALRAAGQQFRAEHGISEDVALSDDALRIRPGDDEVIISFTVETAEDERMYPAHNPARDACGDPACAHRRDVHLAHGKRPCTVAGPNPCGCTSYRGIW